MLLKDRRDAGRQLAEVIVKDHTIMAEKEQLLVASILRGGALVGYEIAKRLSVLHLFLAVTKISHPDNKELAIGAVCKGVYFLDNAKFIKKDRLIKNKSVIIVDDGIATGESVRAAAQYVKKKQTRKIFLAVPVAPSDFDISEFDRTIILQKAESFYAVSQFYTEFHQVSDQEILKMEALN